MIAAVRRLVFSDMDNSLTVSMAVFAVLRRVRMLLLCVFCLPAKTWSYSDWWWNFSWKPTFQFSFTMRGCLNCPPDVSSWSLDLPRLDGDP